MHCCGRVQLQQEPNCQHNVWFSFFFSYIWLFTQMQSNASQQWTRLSATYSLSTVMYTCYIRWVTFCKILHLLWAWELRINSTNIGKHFWIPHDSRWWNDSTANNNLFSQLLSSQHQDPAFYQLQERKQYIFYDTKFRGSMVWLTKSPVK